MTTHNELTGDRLSNTLKGDREAYSKGWDKVFGKKKSGAVYSNGEFVSDDLIKYLDESVEINLANSGPVEAGEVVAKLVNGYLNDQT